MSNTVNWSSYTFGVYFKHGPWNKVGGIYIFARLTPQGWYSLYIGKTQDFSSRPASHELWEEAVQLGATHVHALVVGQEPQRVAIEAELIGTYRPTLNTQHKLW